MTNESTKYDIRERSATAVTVEVSVPAPTVKQQIDSIYTQYGREARIPGFRRGKVPRGLLESRFGRQTFVEEAHKELTEKHLPEALSELSLNPVTTPEVKVLSSEDGEAFVFEATFSVFPEFDLPIYKAVSLAVRPVETVTEQDIQEALEQIQNQFAILSPKEEGIVAPGDVVRIAEGEKEWDLRAEEGHPITGASIGLSVDDKMEIDVPDKEGGANRSSVRIAAVSQIVLPDIDDELAKDAGFDDLQSLKEDVKKKLGEARKQRRDKETKLALVESLVDQAKIDLPEPLVEELANKEMQHLKANLAHPSSSLSFDEYLKRQGKNETELQADYRQQVSRRLRRELIMRKIAETEGIAIGDDELEKIATDEAEARGEPAIRFTASLKAEDRWNEYRTEKVNARVLDLLRDEAQLTEEEG